MIRLHRVDDISLDTIRIHKNDRVRKCHDLRAGGDVIPLVAIAPVGSKVALEISSRHRTGASERGADDSVDHHESDS